MNFKIAVLPGDGIGPEVTLESVKVLEAIGRKYDHTFNFEHGAVGGNAIDDFGSGYSNFVYLVQLKPEYIKIDGSIISGIVDNEQNYLVTKSIVDMARNLNIKTIAEFVSSNAILERLRPLNIDFLQGFHLHRPELC